MVGSDAVHIDRLLSNAPKEISSTDDDSHLAAQGVYRCNLFGYFVDKDCINTETPARCQSFSRDLEEDSFVHVRF